MVVEGGTPISPLMLRPLARVAQHLARKRMKRITCWSSENHTSVEMHATKQSSHGTGCTFSAKRFLPVELLK